MVFNATFNNISVKSWRSVLLVEETVYPEKTTDLSQVTDTRFYVLRNYCLLFSRGRGQSSYTIDGMLLILYSVRAMLSIEDPY
jgi:hypothetical protein